jgi:hypothetical protein
MIPRPRIHFVDITGTLGREDREYVIQTEHQSEPIGLCFPEWTPEGVERAVGPDLGKKINVQGDCVFDEHTAQCIAVAAVYSEADGVRQN